MAKKLLSILLALTLMLGLLPAASITASGAATEFSDMPNNWATEALKSAVANGLLTGYEGKIMPDNPVTRAQLAAIITRAFGATEEGDISSYSDLKGVADWVAVSFARAFKMGVMQGSGGKIEPNSNITREEAFTVLARALKLEPAAYAIINFDDADQVSDWAKGYINALINAGYLKGSNGKLDPKANISRAQFAQIMYNIIKQYINVAGEYTKVADGNIMVNVPGVTLKNVTINGDLIVGDGVGDGDLILNNVKILGRLVVRGGGVNSIIIIGGSVEGKVVIAKVDGEIRVSVQDGADVEVIVVDDGKDDVIIEGSIGTVEINTPDVPVIIQNATIDNVVVNCEGAADITVANNSKVSYLVIGDSADGTTVNVSGQVTNIVTFAAGTSIFGTGTVGTVTANAGANNTSVTTPNTVVRNNGATGVTAGGGSPVPANGSATNNGSGSGIITPSSGNTGGNSGTGNPPAPPIALPIYVPVTRVSVDGEATVGSTLTAEISPAYATVKYQWMRANTVNGTYTEINGATSSTYTLGAADAGKYIRVKVTGTGFFVGTKTSAAVGPVVDTTVPVVYGTITRDPGLTGGEDLEWRNAIPDAIVFDRGEIKWYPADEELFRTAGNRVGVQINAPEGFDTSETTVTINDHTYSWDEIEDGDGYFWWYPLITSPGQEFHAIVQWNSASVQVFVVAIGDEGDITLEPAPVVEPSKPTLTVTGPEEEVALDADSFTVTFEVTHDKDLEYLEIDHNLGKHGSISDEKYQLPEFKLYPYSDNPWASPDMVDAEVRKAYAEGQGLYAEYDSDDKTWTLTFGGDIFETIRDLTIIHTENQFKIYSLVRDVDGVQSGSMYDGSYETTIVTFVPLPLVSGTISWDPGYTGGEDLDVDVEGDTITFSGEIEWYPEAPNRAAGNRVGVQITAPAGFDTSETTVTINDHTYSWDEIEDGDGYFWWYPLITSPGQTFTATVQWNEISSQTFTIVIGDGVTLVSAPTEPGTPILTVTGPEEDVALDADSFTVTFEVTHDKDLEYLEIDHNLGKHGSISDEKYQLPEFKLYPYSDNPWASPDMVDAAVRKAYAEGQGLYAAYDPVTKTWTLTFGGDIFETIRDLTIIHTENQFKIYSLVRDVDGVQSGSMYDGSYETTIVTFVPLPLVSGTITRDPGLTGGEDLEWRNAIPDAIVFDRGEIKWYPSDEALNRTAGNRVGVQINAPDGFDTSETTVTINDHTYSWDEIEDGDGYFWWYPLVTSPGQEFHVIVQWNSASVQVFVVAIGDESDITLEPAPDTTAPILESVTPAKGPVVLTHDQTFVLTVDASDTNLYELEIDHNISGLPEFSVYADADNPYGSVEDKALFEGQGVKVTYDADDTQKWTIDFGANVTQQIVDNGGITFYLVIYDTAGNQWGSMYSVSDENTFAYTVLVDTAYVSNLSEFKAALAIPTLSTINITADFNTDETIHINRPVTINGGNHTITFTASLSVNWDYILDVFDTTGIVTISNIRLNGADVALRVDNAYVTLLGDINLNFNGYYGIEVFNDSHLDVTGATFTNINEVYQHPTIKQYGVVKKVTYNEGQFTLDEHDEVIDYYLP